MIKTNLELEKIKDIVQDANINFLLGSGLSCPFLKTLSNIEKLLTELTQQNVEDNRKDIIRASLYKKYFDDAIVKNLVVLESKLNEGANEVLSSYKKFLKQLNILLHKRKSTILSKEVNLFTTNIDIFVEKALEELGLEFNDGFNGRFIPTFSLSHFKKTRFKKSLHYDNSAEIPVFNHLKLHGSVSWVKDGNKIVFSNSLWDVKNVKSSSEDANFVTINDSQPLEQILESQSNGDSSKNENRDAFVSAYEKLLIVNPTKEKFKDTLLNQTYYELLRIYSNELEKENTVLFVMGFSFADEHIREMTVRAANSNPTLMVYIFAYDSEAAKQIGTLFSEQALSNNNIQIIAPKPNDESHNTEASKDNFQYDLKTITEKVFDRLLESTDQNGQENVNEHG